MDNPVQKFWEKKEIQPLYIKPKKGGCERKEKCENCTLLQHSSSKVVKPSPWQSIYNH